MNALQAIDLSHPALRWVGVLLVQTTLIAAGALWASRYMRRDAASRHAVLLVALFVLLAGPIAGVAFERAGWAFVTVPVPKAARSEEVPFDPAGSALLSGPAQEALKSAPAPKVASRSADVTNTNLTPAPTDASTVDTSDRIAVNASGAEMPAAPAGPNSMASSRSFNVLNAILIFAAAIWAVGVVACVARIVHGWRIVQRMRRSAVPLDQAGSAISTARIEQLLRMRSRLQIFVSDEAGTAVATGLFHPIVLVPRTYIENLAESELGIVLTHEAAHVLRRDLAVGVLQRLAGALYWPHPLVHLLNLQLSRAREEVCDNYVLQHHDSPGYAEVLFRIVKSSHRWRAPVGTLAFFSHRWKLEERITDLLDSNRSRATHPRRRLLVSAVILLCGLGVWLAGLRIIDGPINIVATAEPAKADALLPGGANLRLGDNRFRHNGWHKNIGYSSDGTLISSSENSLKFWKASSGELLREVTFEKFQSRQMRLTHDRKQIACLGHWIDAATSTATHSIRLWDAETGAPTSQLELTARELGGLSQFVITPDSRFALVGDSTGYISVWDLQFGARLLRYRIANQDIVSLAISSDGNLVAASTQSRELFLWEWQAGNEPTLLNSGQRFAGVAFSQDGKRLAAAVEGEAEVQIYDVESRFVVQTLADASTPSFRAEELAFTPDGHQLAAANCVQLSDQFVAAVLLWNVESGKLEKRFSAPPMLPRALAISPDGSQLAAIDWDTNIRLWDIETGASIGSQAGGHNGLIRAMAYSPSSRQLYTASEDFTVRIWDSDSGKEIGSLRHQFPVYALAISADGKSAATANIHDGVTLWDLSTWEERAAIEGTRNLGTSLALVITPDGKELRAIRDDLKLNAWDAATAKALRTTQLRPSGLDLSHENGALSLPSNPKPGEVYREQVMELISDYKFTADGSRLILVGRDWYWVFDAASGNELTRRELSFVPRSAALSADGRTVAIGGRSRDGEEQTQLALFDLETGKALWQSSVATTFCGPIAFSQDGKMLSAVMRSRERNLIEILDATTGKLRHTIAGILPVGAPGTLVLSPDGKQLACADQDAMVLIWEMARLNADSSR